MLDTVCTYPLESDLFAQAVHPKAPVISVGLASGHVHTLRLPPSSSPTSPDSDDHRRSSLSSNGCGTVDTIWKTRRHKGSCRSLAFSPDGEKLFSAGTDSIVKLASTETGVVEWKTAVPPTQKGMKDFPALVKTLDPQSLLVAADSGALHVFDLRQKSIQPQLSFRPHLDYITSITLLPPSETSISGFSRQWISTGGTTLAITDIRRGILSKSDDQEEELMSSAYVGGLSKRGTSVGEKVVVGGADGVMTLWEKGVWDDQDERIIVESGRGGGSSLDVLAGIPEDMGLGRGLVAVGLEDGRLKIVRIGQNRVIAELRHDEVEGVVGIDFDVEQRMVSGGGQVIKVWQKALREDRPDQSRPRVKRQASDLDDSASEDDDDEGDSSDEEVQENRKRPKKRKRNVGKTRVNGQNGLAFNDLD